MQGGTLQCAAGIPTVVIPIRQSNPALCLLAGDVGYAGLMLGIQTVEVLFESFFGRLARVDGTTDWTLRIHNASPITGR